MSDMDLRYLLRNLLIALVGLLLIVLVVVLIAKAISGLSHNVALTPELDLTQYTNSSSSVQLLIDGPITSNIDHRQVRITVSADKTEVDVLQGYQGTVEDSRTYANNSASYSAFLQALQRKGFAKGTEPTSSGADDGGYCATGDRYNFSFNDGNRNRFDFWTSNCGGGTFKGAANDVVALFRAQVPQADTNLIKDFNSVSYTPGSGSLLL